MPIAITKYTCQFKCGKSAMSARNQMETHEGICWNNPANHTCNTCKYKSYSTQTEDYGTSVREWKERHCFHPEGDKITEEVYESLKIDVMHIKPVVNCQFHKLKKGNYIYSQTIQSL